MMTRKELFTTLLTLLVGALGSAAAVYAHMPAPYLTGPAIVVSVGGLAGLRFLVSPKFRDVCFVVIGISMGAGVTPEVLEAARSWPSSFLLMLLNVLIVYWAAFQLLNRGFGYDAITAKLASAPGHLSFVLGLGSETKADLPSVVTIQSVRVLALTVSVPIIVTLLHLEGSGQATVHAPMTALMLAVAAALALLVGRLFIYLKLPAAFLLGGAFISTIGHFQGALSGPVPQWLAIPAYVTMGSLIGSRFSGTSLAALRKAFVAGGVVTVVVVIISALSALVVVEFTGLPVNAVFIAFAPGGLETMAAMAILMGADTTYVGAHHVLRIFFLTVILPFIVRKRDVD